MICDPPIVQCVKNHWHRPCSHAFPLSAHTPVPCLVVCLLICFFAMAEIFDSNLQRCGLPCVQSITTDLLTIPDIDAMRLNPTPIACAAGGIVIGVAPGDQFGCVSCSLVHDSATQFKNHSVMCTGCPNPHHLKGDGPCHKTVDDATKCLATKDQQ